MSAEGRNRLGDSSSPYLLQHAGNPVHWWPWGPDALMYARESDRPIFLSVGYSSCHWCHVMERESFEDPEIAHLLNTYFVPVKVDREERPDLDDVYMMVTQIITGRGGWPNSVWLMPDGRPWYAGTYFPKVDRGPHPGFQSLLVRLAEIWRTRRADVLQQAEALVDALRRHAARTSNVEAAAGFADTFKPLVGRSLVALEEEYDLRHGGFGDAPKFPPHAAMRLLLTESEHDARTVLKSMVTGTLDAMAAGGLQDHVGGGFHRYSTDAHWFLPHFEKMLYDNAQLARVYASAYTQTGQVRYRTVAERTLAWVYREMRDPQGGFYSALDADSDGEEGLFYLWSTSELRQVLGESDAARLISAYGASDAGNHHDEATGRPTGLNILHATSPEMAPDLSPLLERLQAHRQHRIAPFRDDKVLTAWNGLMIGALATAGRILECPQYIEAAESAAHFILKQMRPDGRLRRTWRNGQCGPNGFLDDHAAMIDGLVDLYEATAKTDWRDNAIVLAHDMNRWFRDETDGGYFTSGSDQESLIIRQKDAFDPACPSGNGLAARALIRLGAITGDPGWREQGADVLRARVEFIKRSPTGCCTLLEAAILYLDATQGLHIARQHPFTLTAVRTEGRIHLTLHADPGWSLDPKNHRPNPSACVIIGPDAHPHVMEWDQAAGTCSLTVDDQGTARSTFQVKASACEEGRCVGPLELSITL